MSQMSRHEIVELLKKFQERHLPGLKTTDASDDVLVCIARIERYFEQTDGIPDLTLRGYGKLLKHYGEEPKGPKVIPLFNCAVRLFETNGGDVTKAIKRARVEVEKVPSNPQRAVKVSDEILQSMADVQSNTPVPELAVNNQI